MRTMGGAGRAFLQRWRTTRDGVIWSAHSATAIRWTADIICGPWLLVSGAWLRAAQGDSEAAHVGGDQRGDVQHAGGAARGVHPEQADKINLGASWPFNRAVGPIKSFHSPYALRVCYDNLICVTSMIHGSASRLMSALNAYSLAIALDSAEHPTRTVGST